MSEPKRYDIDSDGVPYPLDTGDYVRHSDYASLQAENERLRKAGDLLMECYCYGDLNRDEWKQLPSVKAWLAAKEGRDAK